MRILLVEDDVMLGDGMVDALRSSGYTVDWLQQGMPALSALKSEEFAALVLDLNLPDIDGISLLRKLRREGQTLPVLILTARDALDDRVLGLDAGSDDYMVKPFAFEELLARIHSIMRRPGKWGDLNLLKLGDIAFDPECGRLTKGAKECTLSGRESALLEVFLRNPGQVLPRNLLLSRVWGMESDVEEGNLDNYIHFLRRRLKSVESTLVLKTIRGIGYQLEVCQ